MQGPIQKPRFKDAQSSIDLRPWGQEAEVWQKESEEIGTVDELDELDELVNFGSKFY